MFVVKIFRCIKFNITYLHVLITNETTLDAACHAINLNIIILGKLKKAICNNIL